MKSVTAYLVSIILANLLIGYLGKSGVFIVAFLFIGLDFTLRDKLHDYWQRKNLFPKMTLLILSGSVLSWLLNSEVRQIATASFIAFLFSASFDFLVYHFLRNKTKRLRVNGSNLVGSLVDSLLFPTIAFGAFLPLVILGQFAAKFLGGLFWYFLLRNKK